MSKQPIAVELEAINREGETQVVRDSGLATCRTTASTCGLWRAVGWRWPPR